MREKWIEKFKQKQRKNAIVELMGPKGNGDMQAANRDWNAPPTDGRQI